MWYPLCFQTKKLVAVKQANRDSDRDRNSDGDRDIAVAVDRDRDSGFGFSQAKNSLISTLIVSKRFYLCTNRKELLL